MISVIICTRNPRPDHLERTIAALRRQSGATNTWELLVVDNASDVPLSPDGLIDWHPNGRVVREDKQGVTFARLRGIEESKGEWLLFVDDDNVLADNYIAEALRIAGRHPDLGAFGAGVITPEFESATPRLPWLAWQHLTVRRHLWKIKSTKLSPRHCPSGAGMVVRRDVAELYLQKVRSGKLSLATLLEIVGVPLSNPGANDFDLGFQSGDLNKSMGVFPSLKLTHLMPAYRTEEGYLLRLVRNNARAMALLAFVYQEGRFPRNRLPRRVTLLRWVSSILGSPFRYRLKHEWWLGEIDAHQLITKHRNELEELQRQSIPTHNQ